MEKEQRQCVVYEKNKQITTRSIIIKMKEIIRRGTDNTSHIQTGKEFAVSDR